MSGNKAHLSVFFASFLTFMLAFGTMLFLAEPEMGMSAPARGEPTIDSVFAPGESARRGPDTDRPASRKPSGDGVTAKPRAAVVGRVLDTDGQPVRGAQVHFLRLARPKSTSDSLQSIKAVETEDDGRFRCHPKVLPQKFWVVVCADGFARSRIPPVSLQGRRHLDLGEVLLDRGGQLLFEVRNEEGRAVEGASVLVRDPDAEMNGAVARPLLRGATDDRGVLGLRGADFGQYAVSITKPGHAPFNRAFNFDITPGQQDHSVEAVLSIATSYVSGSVSDGAGYPVREGVVVVETLRQEGPPARYRAAIDHSGNFRAGPLPGGDYRVHIETPGLLLRRPTYAAADEPPIRLVVEHGGIVFGRIRCAGTLSKAPTLSLQRRDRQGRMVPFSGQFSPVVATETGEFEIDGLPPGCYVIRASAAGWAAGRSEPFSIGPGQRRRGLEISLGNGGTITGQILGARGEDLGEVQVTAYEGRQAPPPAIALLYDDATLRRVLSDEQGQFMLERLSPGSHVLLFEKPGLPPRTIGPVQVQDNASLRLGSISLGSGGSISGTLRDAEGQPVSDAALLLATEAGSTWMCLLTDTSGNFSVQGLAQGSYCLRQSTEGWSGNLEDGVRLTLGDGEHRRQDLGPER